MRKPPNEFFRLLGGFGKRSKSVGEVTKYGEERGNSALQSVDICKKRAVLFFIGSSHGSGGIVPDGCRPCAQYSLPEILMITRQTGDQSPKIFRVILSLCSGIAYKVIYSANTPKWPLTVSL